MELISDKDLVNLNKNIFIPYSFGLKSRSLLYSTITYAFKKFDAGFSSSHHSSY